MGNTCNKRCRGDRSDSNKKSDLGGGNVQILTTKEAWDQRLSEACKDGRTVVVNFSVSWCKPCRNIAPTYRELSEKYPFLMFLIVDVDELAEVSTSLDIKATPTFYFLKDGQEIDKLVGANKLELQNKVTTIANSVNQSSS